MNSLSPLPARTEIGLARFRHYWWAEVGFIRLRPAMSAEIGQARFRMHAGRGSAGAQPAPYQTGEAPPSTLIAVPVTNAAASETSRHARFANSSGLPMRPSGMFLAWLAM